MLGGSQGLGGTSQRTGGLWPLASAPLSPATSFTSDGYSKYGFYSLFSGAPTFGSTLYSHNTVGRFGPALQAPGGGAAFHTTHKVSDSLFSTTGYTFGAPTPPPGSPYSPVSVAQLEFLAKGYTTTTNSNIIIQQSPICQQQDLPATPSCLSPTKKTTTNQIIITPSSSHHQDACKELKLNGGAGSAFRASQSTFKHHQQYIYQPNECMLKLTTLTQQSEQKDCHATTSSGGCSRTNPLEWTTLSPIHVKKEPGTLLLSDQGEAIIKMEMTSPVQKAVGHQELLHQATASIPSIVTANGNIPVGIAVGRQRIQQEVVAPSGILTTTHFKEIARISEIADINAAHHAHAAAAAVMQQQHHHNQQHQLHHGVGATSAQHTTTTAADCWGLMGGIAQQQQHCHQSAAHQSAAGTTLWTTAQYPTPLPMEPLLPMSAVGLPLQLVREPTSGGFLLFPTAGIEPVQQAAAIQLWPNSATSYPTSTPTSHVLLPTLPPPPQPPPPPLQLITSTAQAHHQQQDINTYQQQQHHHHHLLATGGTGGNTGGLITTISGAQSHHQSTRMQLVSASMKGCLAKGIKVEEMGNMGVADGAAPHGQDERNSTNLQIYESSPPLLNLIYQPAPPSNSPPNLTNPLTNVMQTFTSNQTTSEQLMPEQMWKQQTSTSGMETVSTSTRSQATSPVVCLTPPPETDNTVRSLESMNSTIETNVPDEIILKLSENAVAEKQQPVEEKMVQDASNQTEAISDEEMTATVDSKLSADVQEANVPNVGGIECSEEDDSSAKSVESTIVESKVEQVKLLTEEEEVLKPDFSGLDLLSNSILEHETNTNLVVLPEKVPDFVEETPDDDVDDDVDVDVKLQKPLPIVEENLGGLDLLCALAEQRLEEATQKSDLIKSRINTIEDLEDLEEPEVKRAKIDNKEQISLPRRCNNCKCNVDDEPYKNYKTKESEQEFKKFIASKAPSLTEYNYKEMAANNLMNDSERDMRQQLADLQRKYKEKQRELNKLKPHHSGSNNKKVDCNGQHQKKKHSRKKSTNSNGSTDRDISPQPPVLEPQVDLATLHRNAEQSLDPPGTETSGNKLTIEKRRHSSSNSTSNGTHAKRRRKVGRPKKLEWSSDNESSSNNLINPSTETIVAKKQKKIHQNLVGYLLAAKERLLVQKGFSTDSPPRFVEEVPLKIGGTNKKIGPKLKAEARVSMEMSSDDFLLEGDVKQRVHFESEDSEIGDFNNQEAQENREEVHIPNENGTIQVEGTQNSSDFSSDDCQPLVIAKPSAPDIEEAPTENEIIDSRCILTQDLLETDRLRVLTAMGGLFYAGNLNAVQPPDVYSITLDGERGNRPHIMSREEILRDAIIEVSPSSTDDLPPGTRLCAYWSQQYRCLYPGSVAESGSPIASPRELDKKFVAVEFDDGDNGTISIEDIRLLPCDYPIIEYDPNPLLSLSKRKRRLSTTEDRKFTQSPPISSTKIHSHNIDSPQKDKNIEKENKDLNLNEANKLTTNESELKTQRSKERKRLKKRKREKLREKQRCLSNIDGDTLKKKKKRKHKCLGDQCKHKRHHKKHKKHHRKHQKGDNKDKRKDKEEKLIEKHALEVEEAEEVFPEYHIVPNTDDEGTMDDIIEDISKTNSKKIRDRQESCESRSKMSAFLPPRQFWNWSGKGYKRPRGKGRSKKEFFKSIQRGKENMTVGDSAVFLSTGRPDRPYIGKIEAFWETCGTMVVKVKWFYHPEETNGCPLNLKYPGALFESPHIDENDVQTISHHCRVVPLSEYTTTLGSDPTRYATIYDNNDIYYRAGYYDPTTCQLSMDGDIPLEDE